MATATATLQRPPEVPRDRFEVEVLQHRGQVLVELWQPGKDTRFFTQALVEQAQRHPDVKLVRINVDEYRDLIDEYHRRRAINQTYDLAHVPGVALFRNGKLITTMKPLIVNSDPALIAYNVRRQLDVFLAKFVEDVKTSVPSDESDAPGGAGAGGKAAAPADDREAKVRAALEKAAKLKAERAKQRAAAGGGAGARQEKPGAGAGAAAPAKAAAAGAADKDARVQAALEKAARLKAERAQRQAAGAGAAAEAAGSADRAADQAAGAPKAAPADGTASAGPTDQAAPAGTAATDGTAKGGEGAAHGSGEAPADEARRSTGAPMQDA
ncbi:MAG TPA: thioredoxin family protein [Thermaerobacter sp.]